MTFWSTVDRWEIALGLVTKVCIVVSEHMLISVLSMSVELWEFLVSDVCLYLVKFILNQILPLCLLFGSLSGLGLGEFSLMSPLRFKPSLAHFNRRLVAAG